MSRKKGVQGGRRKGFEHEPGEFGQTGSLAPFKRKKVNQFDYIINLKIFEWATILLIPRIWTGTLKKIQESPRNQWTPLSTNPKKWNQVPLPTLKTQKTSKNEEDIVKPSLFLLTTTKVTLLFLPLFILLPFFRQKTIIFLKPWNHSLPLQKILQGKRTTSALLSS